MMISFTPEQVEQIREQLEDWQERPIAADEVEAHLQFIVNDIVQDPIGYLTAGFKLPKLNGGV